MLVPFVTSTGTHFSKPEAGFVPVKRATPILHESHIAAPTTLTVSAGSLQIDVPLTGAERQPGGNCQVFLTPGCNARVVWVSEKRRHGFTVQFERPPTNGAPLDVVVTREPFRNSRTEH